jgi:hypothetical protein
MNRLRGALVEANERGVQHLKMDRSFAEAILSVMHHKEEAYLYLKGKFDGVKVSSALIYPLGSCSSLCYRERASSILKA